LRFLPLLLIALIAATVPQHAALAQGTAYAPAPLIGRATPDELKALRTAYLRHALQPTLKDFMPSVGDPSLRPSAKTPAGRVAEDAPVLPTASVVTSTEQTVDATLTNGLASGFANGAASEAPWYMLDTSTDATGGLPTGSTPINTDVTWSHNETFLVFSSNITGYYQLYVISASGGQIAIDSRNNPVYVEQLTGLTNATATTNVRYPSLLGPNDTSIAYCADTLGNGMYHLFVSPFNNNGVGYSVNQAPASTTALAQGYFARHPFYIGDQIYFSGRALPGDSYNIYSVSVSTNIVVAITGPATAGFDDNDNPNFSAYNQLAWDSTASGFTYNSVTNGSEPLLTAAAPGVDERNIYVYTQGKGVVPITTGSSAYENVHPVWTTGSANDFVVGTGLDLFFDSNRVSAFPPGNTAVGHSIYYFPAYQSTKPTVTTAYVPGWVSGAPTILPVASVVGIAVGDTVEIQNLSPNYSEFDNVLGIDNSDGVTALLVQNTNSFNSGSNVIDVSLGNLQLVNEATAADTNQVDTSDPTHLYDDEQVSVSSLLPPYISVAYISNRYLLDSISDNPLTPNIFTSTSTEATATGLSPVDYVASDIEPKSYTPNGGPNNGKEVMISRLTVLGPPSIIRFNESNSEVVHVYAGDLSAYDKAAATSANATTTHFVQSGQDATFVVRLSERQVGIGQAWLQIKDPESASQSTTGLEHKVFTQYTDNDNSRSDWTTNQIRNASNEATYLYGKATGGTINGIAGYGAIGGWDPNTKAPIELGNQVIEPSSGGVASLIDAAQPGDKTITVSSIVGFAVNDQVSINTGGADVETGVVKAVNEALVGSTPPVYTITLTSVLLNAHIVGESVTDSTLIGSPTAPPAISISASTPVAAGTTTLPVSSLQGISAGSQVVVNPGSSTTEDVSVSGVTAASDPVPASITLTVKTQFAHSGGERIIVIGADGGIAPVNAASTERGVNTAYQISVSNPGNLRVGDIVGIYYPNATGPVVAQEAEITSMTGTSLNVDRSLTEVPATEVVNEGFYQVSVGGTVYRIARTAFDPMGQEVDCQAIDLSAPTTNAAGDEDIISANPSNYYTPTYTPGNEDSSGEPFDHYGTPKDTAGNSLWLQLEPMPQNDQDSNGGVLYYATWTTPLDPSDYYIDVIAEDASFDENWRIYDNIWGFTTHTFQQANSILVVNDYALPQKFFNNNIASNGPGAEYFGTESYWTDINNNIAGWQSFFGLPISTMNAANAAAAPTVVLPLIAEERQTVSNVQTVVQRAKIIWGASPLNAFIPNSSNKNASYFPYYTNGLGVNSYFDGGISSSNQVGTGVETTNLANSQKYDIWRILSRGPVPTNVLNAYGATTVQAPVDPFNSALNTTRVVAPSCVVWLSPAAGNNYVGAGTITDSNTQTLLDTFLQNGGRLHMEGPSIGYALTENGGTVNSFYNNDLNDDYSNGNAYIQDTDSTTNPLNVILASGSGTPIAYDTYPGASAVGYHHLSYLFPLAPATGTSTYESPSGGPITIADWQPSYFQTNIRTDAALDCASGYMDPFRSNAATQLTNPDGNQEVFYASNAESGKPYYGSEVSYSSFGIAAISQEVQAYNDPKAPDGFVGPDGFVTLNQRTNIIHNIVCELRTGLLTGLVTTSGEGAQPIPNATVVATSLGGVVYTGSTNGFGQYTIKGVPAGQYQVVAYKEGYSFQHETKSMALTHGGDTGGVNLTLSLSGNGSLQVFVVSSIPVTYLSAAAQVNATSIVVGSVAGLAVGQTIDIDAGNSNFDDVTISAIDSGTNTLTISKLAYSHINGAPVQTPLLGAGVIPSEVEGGLAPSEQFTPADGVVTFPAIASGAYNMSASLLGYSTAVSSVNIAQGANPAIVLVLDPLPINITGLVYQNGTMTNSTLSAAVASGATTLPVASTTGFAVGQTAEIDAGTAVSEYVSISASTTAPPSLTVTATANPHASGAVITAALPVPAATLTITGPTGTALATFDGGDVTATTAANGVYTFAIPAGDYAVPTALYVTGGDLPIYLVGSAVSISTQPGTINATQTYVDVNVPLTLVPTPAVAPIISPPSGSYATSPLAVTINDTQAGSTIYYTIDGTTPVVGNSHTSPYTVPLSETASTVTIKAIAVADGFSTSPTTTATYTIGQTVPSLTIAPAAGAYTTTQSVAISDTLSGVAIYYTTDGTIPSLVSGLPTGSTTAYTGAITVSATPSETINAVGIATGYNNSPIASAVYTIAQSVPTPVISPTAGPYAVAQTVTITDDTAPTGYQIYYSINGTTPTTSSLLYSGPIMVSTSQTIKAIAVATGYFNSTVAAAKYIIGQTVPTPTFSPNGGPYINSQLVTLSDTQSGSTIFYTVSGGSDTPIQYVVPIQVSATATITAYATEQGYINSQPADATFTIGATVETPTISPNGGAFLTATQVTITNIQAGATVYYTTDGTPPTTASKSYTGPFMVSTTQVITAAAFENGYNTSTTAPATFVIGQTLAVPQFSPPGGRYLQAQAVSLTDVTAGASIYYTTDGSAPSVTAGVANGSTLLYSASVPILVGPGSETIKAIAVDSGYITSSISSASYTIGATVATPNVSPNGGAFSTATTVTIADTTAGSAIYFTTDGQTPAPGNADTSLYAAASLSSASASGTELLPVTSITGFQAGQQIIIDGATGNLAESATIASVKSLPAPSLTLTKGTTYAHASGASVAESIIISTSTTLSAIGTLSGYYNSDPTTAVFTIGQTVAAPTFNPPAGPYAASQNISISAATVGSLIYYTTDGTMPSLNSSGSPVGSTTAYTGPVVVSTSQTLTAISVEPGYFSGIGTATYSIGQTLPPPAISPNGGASTTAKTVTLTDAAAGASIYYSIDGSVPSATSATSSLYSTPFSVSTNNEKVAAIAVEAGYENSNVSSATFTVGQTLALPVIAPGSEASSTALSVVLSDANSGAKLYYTTDGSTPTANSTAYSGAITVATSQTITVIAIQSGYYSSPVATAAYTIGQSVPTPTISPDGGQSGASETVTLADSMGSASLYYTTDGTTPALLAGGGLAGSTQLYSTPLTVSSSETITVIGVAAGYTNSSVASAGFTIGKTVPVPTFTPGTSSSATAMTVTIADALSGTTIYYTTNGSTPTTASTQYQGPITVSSTETITAIGVETGYATSSTGSATYTITSPTIASFGAGLQMISLPQTYTGVSLDTIFGYSGVKLAVWSPLESIYALTPTAPADSIVAGQGYWVRFPQAVTVALPGTATPTNTSFVIQLEPGWNQIGDPFTSAVPLSTLMFASQTQTFAQASSGSTPLIGGTVYGYSNSSNAYQSASSLTPGQGYWIFAESATNLEVPAPNM
jgi:hypothetical protein